MSYIRVLNSRVPLDNSYNNVIAFKNLLNSGSTTIVTHESKASYFTSFDGYYNDLASYTKINFKYGDTVHTSVKLLAKTLANNLDIVISGLNYAHVINDENPRFPNELFYFITSSKYLNSEVIELQLELDIFTTFFDHLRLNEDLKPIYTERCHCDRFNLKGTSDFGCEEALLPDEIDSLFNANILKYKQPIENHLLTNDDLWCLVYISTNGKMHGLTGGSVTVSGNALYYSSASARDTGVNFATTLDTDVALPYMICAIPLKAKTFTFVDNLGNTLVTSYGLNSILTSTYGKSIYDYLKTNAYVYSIQIVTTSFMDNITTSDNTYNLNSGKCGGSLITNNDSDLLCLPLLVLQNLTSSDIEKIRYVDYLDLLKGISGDTTTFDFAKDTMLSATSKITDCEPKLYSMPYAHYTFGNVLQKEYEFSLINAVTNNATYGEVVQFNIINAPSTQNSGETIYVTSGDYSLYRKNYNGNPAVSSSEIPLLTSAYETFLATQKNSYYTGIGISYFNNALGVASGSFALGTSLATGNPLGIASGIISTTKSAGDLLFQQPIIDSKMKDLQNTPYKLTNTNFDIFSAYLTTDLHYYINVYSLIDEEKSKVFDYYYLNGYKVEKFRELNYNSSSSIISSKKSIITRRLFDFVQVKENLQNRLQYMGGGSPLSLIIRQRFNDIFNRGVRLWFITSNAQFLDFTLENKEIN